MRSELESVRKSCCVRFGRCNQASKKGTTLFPWPDALFFAHRSGNLQFSVIFSTSTIKSIIIAYYSPYVVEDTEPARRIDQRFDQDDCLIYFEALTKNEALPKKRRERD